MSEVRIVAELKRDAFGHIELLERLPVAGGVLRVERVVRRVAAARPGLGPLARALARRERRVLAALGDLEHRLAPEHRSGLGGLVEDAVFAAHPDLRGRVPRTREVVLRAYVPGAPLHRAETLPYDFFALLEDLVRALHGVGLCHNDLHKEQNIVVRPDGRPALIDFQLASLHPHGGRVFESRCRDDLRHVQKHLRRYTRDGRGPAELAVPEEARMPRRGVARIWRRTVKPVYTLITRRLLRTRDGEERRPATGPWPRWVEAVRTPPPAL